MSMVLPQDIQDAIARVEYHLFRGTTKTVCCLTLTNGFTVLGESAACDPAEFDAGRGQVIARAKAENNLAAFLAYAHLEGAKK